MGTFLMKLYTKKEKKLSGSFWEINILSEKLTTTDDDRRRRRRTTDESALEKLRCLSAGGANNKKSPKMREERILALIHRIPWKDAREERQT